MIRIFFVVIIITTLVACDDITDSQLPGKWHLKTVDKNGLVSKVDTIWYNFQSESVFALQFYISHIDQYVTLYGMKVQNKNNISIELISDAYLDEIDWNSRNRTFTIETLNNKLLTLKSQEGYIYSFIRF